MWSIHRRFASQSSQCMWLIRYKILSTLIKIHNLGFVLCWLMGKLNAKISLKPSIMLNSFKFICFLLDVYFLSSKWIAKSLILTYTKNLLRKNTKPPWMNEWIGRKNKSMLLFPIFLTIHFYLYTDNNNNNSNYGDIITYFESRHYNNWYLNKWNFVSANCCR